MVQTRAQKTATKKATAAAKKAAKDKRAAEARAKNTKTRSATKNKPMEMPDWLKPKPLQETKKSDRKAEATRIMKAMAKDRVPKSKLTAQGRRIVDMPCSGAIAPGSKPKAISVRHYRQERKGKMVTIKGHCRGVPGNPIADRKKAARAPKAKESKTTDQKELSAQLAAIRKRNEKQRKEAKKQEKKHKGIKAVKKAEKEGYKAGTQST